jgi:hypothetical protein
MGVLLLLLLLHEGVLHGNRLRCGRAELGRIVVLPAVGNMLCDELTGRLISLECGSARCSSVA